MFGRDFRELVVKKVVFFLIEFGFILLMKFKIVFVQIIFGIGVVYIVVQFIVISLYFKLLIYVGILIWGNYMLLCELFGFNVVYYRYFDFERCVVDFDLVLKVVYEVFVKSIFVFQGCCYNLMGVDFMMD